MESALLIDLVIDLVIDLATYYDRVDLHAWLSLRQTCRRLRNKFTAVIFPAWGRQTRARLVDHIGPCAEKVAGHNLTGGFLLDCIYNTTHSTDVDILTNRNQSPVTLHLPSPERARLCLPKPLICAMNDCGYKDMVTYQRDHVHSFAVCTFSANDSPPIDIIMIGDTQPADHVRKYDLVFCRVAYDGRKLYIEQPDSVIRKHANISDGMVENIMSMADYDRRSYDPEYVRALNVVRVAKYTARGFTVGPVPAIDVYQYWCTKLFGPWM